MSNQPSQTNQTKAINSRPNIHGNTPVSKCMTSGNMTATECSLGSFIANSSSNLRVNKQTASGDTGDTNLLNEQPKYSIEEYHTTTVSSSHSTANSGRTSSVTVNHSGSAGKYAPPNFNSTSGISENKTNLIINYLPPNMTQEEVRALFSSIGEVESCKLVREKTSGESLGYAFVKFYNPADAGRAIKTLNGLRLQNKTVKVSLARPSSDAIKGANLYICGLPRKMTQPELEKLFSTCGHIITARILYDTKTGLSRGVAFIRYDQRTEAEVAIRRLNGYVPSGANEPITVKFANSPSSNRQENAIPTSVKPIDQELPTSRYNGNGVNICNTSPVSPLGDMGICPVNNPTKSSLNPTTNEGFTHDIALPMSAQQRQFSAPRGSTPSPDFPNAGHKTGPVTPIHSQPSCNSQCIYGNLVDGNSGVIIGRNMMPYTAQSVQNAYSMPLPNVNSFNELNVVRPDAGVVGPVQRVNGVTRFKYHPTTSMAAAYTGGASYRLRAPNPMLSSSVNPNFSAGLPNFGMDFMRGLGQGAHALLAPAFAASSGALTATGWCIFVYNLAPDTEESIIWQLFGPFGAVQTVKVIKDPLTNKCKGFGFVTMSNYEDALLAIHSLNGFNLGNRVLQVSFKTTPNTRQMKYTADMFADEFIEHSTLSGSLTPVPGGTDTSVSLHTPQSQPSSQDATNSTHNQQN